MLSGISTNIPLESCTTVVMYYSTCAAHDLDLCGLLGQQSKHVYLGVRNSLSIGYTWCDCCVCVCLCAKNDAKVCVPRIMQRSVCVYVLGMM